MTVNTFGDILVIKIEILSKNSISESLRDKQNIIYIYAYKFVNIWLTNYMNNSQISVMNERVPSQIMVHSDDRWPATRSRRHAATPTRLDPGRTSALIHWIETCLTVEETLSEIRVCPRSCSSSALNYSDKSSQVSTRLKLWRGLQVYRAVALQWVSEWVREMLLCLMASL